jgi:hypothetical protein
VQDALHAAAQTYPVDVGLVIAGTSGTALPGATAGFTTGIQLGGQPGAWGGAGGIDSSIFTNAMTIRDYNTAGIAFSNAIGTGQAITVASTGGNVEIDTYIGVNTPAVTTSRLNVLNASNTNGDTAIIGRQTNNATGAPGTTEIGVTGYGTANHTSGSHGRLYGVQGIGFASGAGGTTVFIAGVAGQGQATAALTISTALSALYSQANVISGGPTVALNTGLYMEAQSGGTAAYQIYSVGTAKSYFAGPAYFVGPSTQTIAATNTITADACSSVKTITAASGVTTNTTDTFTAPSTTAGSGNQGCIMHVCNVGVTNTITLDHNAHFFTVSGADLALPANTCVTVGSDGTQWRQLSAVLTGT